MRLPTLHDPITGRNHRPQVSDAPGWYEIRCSGCDVVIGASHERVALEEWRGNHGVEYRHGATEGR